LRGNEGYWEGNLVEKGKKGGGEPFQVFGYKEQSWEKEKVLRKGKGLRKKRGGLWGKGSLLRGRLQDSEYPRVRSRQNDKK